MARSYSDDLREKFLSSYEAGSIGLEKLAATFQVSHGWAAAIPKALALIFSETATNCFEHTGYALGLVKNCSSAVTPAS